MKFINIDKYTKIYNIYVYIKLKQTNKQTKKVI